MVDYIISIPQQVNLDGVTIDKNATGQLELKSGLILVEKQIISGSAEQNIVFSDLDLNTDGEYEIHLNIINSASVGTESKISIYQNADTTATNYYSTWIRAQNTSLGGMRENNAQIFKGYGESLFCKINVVKRGDNVLIAQTKYSWGNGAEVVIYTHAVNSKNVITSNITTLTLSSDKANTFGIGSIISLYKVF